jgi:hypothetical protein
MASSGATLPSWSAALSATTFATEPGSTTTPVFASPRWAGGTLNGSAAS